MPDFSNELRIGGRVAGIDEAGRGPWAGPVVAAAVVLDFSKMPPLLAREFEGGLNDSKKLSPARRQTLFDRLMNETACVDIGVGRAEVAEIDSENILRATYAAMKRAVSSLSCVPDHLLIDGNRCPDGLPCPAEPLVKGDGKSFSVAAASIIAKVTRDTEMLSLAKAYPGYGWETNMGYGTKVHSEALVRLGATPHHRTSFAPVRRVIENAGL